MSDIKQLLVNYPQFDAQGNRIREVQSNEPANEEIRGQDQPGVQGLVSAAKAKKPKKPASA